MTLLTADDVLNKKFQATKFREGYEQDEVDEFLDEVVEAMRQLEAENADLKAKLGRQPASGAARRGSFHPRRPRFSRLSGSGRACRFDAGRLRRVRWPGAGRRLRHARAGSASPRRARRQR